jgi:hypothetical protein
MHFKCDLFEVLDMFVWDLVIAHPPCTFLCSSGLHWNKRPQGLAINREVLTLEAIEFAERIWACRSFVKHMAIENPQGCLSTRSELGKATQYIQPYQFGHDASKKTGLWLHNLPPLVPTQRVKPRYIRDPKTGNVYERWANQTDSGQNALPPSANRAALRSETYDGVAKAMAAQWGPLL